MNTLSYDLIIDKIVIVGIKKVSNTRIPLDIQKLTSSINK